jgi:hypothetical protein
MEIFSIRAIFFALLPGSENSRTTDFVFAQNGDYFALPHFPTYPNTHFNITSFTHLRITKIDKS